MNQITQRINPKTLSISYSVHEFGGSDIFYGVVSANFETELITSSGSFFKDESIDLAVMYKFGSERTARRHMDKLIESEKRRWSKKKIIEKFNLN